MAYKLCASSKREVVVYSIENESKASQILHSIDSLTVSSVYWSPDNTFLALLLPQELLFLHDQPDTPKQKVESFPLPDEAVNKFIFGYKTARFVYLASESKIHILDRKERKYLDPIKVKFI